jgi:polysaccharide pyruvyl transferase CsaB
VTRLVLSGYYGFGNVGDDAILAGILRAFREVREDASFTVISGKRLLTAQQFGVQAVSRGDVRGIWSSIGEADLLLSGGGSLLQDVTSSKSLVYYLGVLAMAKLQRKPAMIYAQGIGPITRPLSRHLLRQVVNRLETVTVRDHDSAAFLGELGITRPMVAVTADAAIALDPGDPELGRAVLRGAGVEPGGAPLIAASVRNWKAGDVRFMPALAESLDSLAHRTGGRVLFFPMQAPGDLAAAEDIRHLMRTEPVLLRGPHTYQQVMGLAAAVDLVIGLRYHALVFAAMSGTPLVGLSYDPKIDSFLRSIGQEPAGTTDRLETAELTAAALRALEQATALKGDLRRRMADLGALARSNARLALELVEERRRRG